MKRSTLGEFYDLHEEKKEQIKKSRKAKKKMKENFYNEYIVVEEKSFRKQKVNHR